MTPDFRHNTKHLYRELRKTKDTEVSMKETVRAMMIWLKKEKPYLDLTDLEEFKTWVRLIEMYCSTEEIHIIRDNFSVTFSS